MLEPVDHKTPPDWMTGAGLAALFAALETEGPEPAALLVGGCVRDWVLGRPVKDIDIACIHPPEETMRRLKAADLSAAPTGIAHGTVTGIAPGGVTAEITTLRRDVETDGRHAAVAFTDSWREDAARRDFTMNTLLAATDGRIYEPVPGGLADAREGRVRFVGDPARRIAEDYLRILRLFRFHGHYGQQPLAEEALDAVRAAADKIGTLSRERVTAEILKLLAAPAPAESWRLMQGCGVLPALDPDGEGAARLARLGDAGGDAGGGADAPLVRLYVVSGGGADFNAALILSNREKRFLCDLAAARALLPGAAASPKDVKRAMYRYGRAAAGGAYRAACALEGEAPQPALLNLLQNWAIPVFPLTGEDLLAEGYTGPALGQELKRREAEWLGGVCED